MAEKRCYRNCGVFGCTNTTKDNDKSFFSVPKSEERKMEWLKLMLREDLEEKAALSIWVCEDHFDPMSILISEKRKTLKKNALPKYNLPGKKYDEKGCQATVQTLDTDNSKFFASKGSQTPNYLHTKHLKIEIRDCKVKLKRLKTKSEETESTVFFNLCDKFLSKKLAEVVKEHVKQKQLSDIS